MQVQIFLPCRVGRNTATVVLVILAGGEVEVENQIILYVPNVEFGVRNESCGSDQDTDFAGIGIALGRDDLAKVCDVFREILWMRVALGFPSGQIPHLDASIEGGADKERRVDVKIQTTTFTL